MRESVKQKKYNPPRAKVYYVFTHLKLYVTLSNYVIINFSITVKGGVVMFNITKEKRRATVDIDIDLIRHYLE